MLLEGYNASEFNVKYMHHGDKEIFDSWFIFHDKRKEQTMSSVFIWQIFRQTYAVQSYISIRYEEFIVFVQLKKNGERK